MVACHDHLLAGYFASDRTLERLRQYVWWPKMIDSVSTYCHSFKSCQLAKRPSGERPGLLMTIDDPCQQWDVIHMDFVTSLLVAGPLGYDAFLVISCRLTTCIRLVPTHANATAKITALRYADRALPTTGLPHIIIADRDPKFTSAFWIALHAVLQIQISMSTPLTRRWTGPQRDLSEQSSKPFGVLLL